MSYQIWWMDVQSQPFPLTLVLSNSTLCCERASRLGQEQEERGDKKVGSVLALMFSSLEFAENRVLATV